RQPAKDRQRTGPRVDVRFFAPCGGCNVHAGPLTGLTRSRSVLSPPGAAITNRRHTMRSRLSSYVSILLVTGLFFPGISACQDATAELPMMMVHKSPTCGCCAKWIE